MVEFLEINGVKHPIIINFYVIGLFQAETGLELEEFGMIEKKLQYYEPLIWYALKTGYAITKQPFTFTREDMPILLQDDAVYKEFGKIIIKYSVKSAEDQTIKKK